MKPLKALFAFRGFFMLPFLKDFVSIKTFQTLILLGVQKGRGKVVLAAQRYQTFLCPVINKRDNVQPIKGKIMLSNISWGSYFTAIIILIVIWYGFLIYKYHLKDLQDLFQGKWKRPSGKGKPEVQPVLSSQYKESFSTIEDAEELYDKILGVFTESDARGISKTEFENYMRFILSEYPFVKQSALREKINSLAISESLKYSEFVLTGSEMDSLWEERQ